MAILVTVFGHYSRQAGTVLGDSARAQAQQVFTAGASHAFGAAAVFLLAALVLVAAGVRAPGTAPAPAASEPAR